MKAIDRLMLNPIFNGILAAFGWLLFGVNKGIYRWIDLASATWLTLWTLATTTRSIVRYRRGWDPFGTGTEPWQ